MTFLNSIVVKTSLTKIAFLVFCLCLPLKPALACTLLSERLSISICIDDTPWESRKDEGEMHLFYNVPEDFAARVIFYDGGTNDGLDSARSARIMSNSDRNEADDFGLFLMGEVTSGNVVYATRVSRDGVSFIHVNTVSTGPMKTMRVSTWRRSDEMTDRDQEMHISFMGLLKSSP